VDHPGGVERGGEVGMIARPDRALDQRKDRVAVGEAQAVVAGEERLPPAPAPRIGADSEDVLAERLELSAGEIARLIDAGVVGTARTPA
jgi:hypothetical protein